MFRRLTSSLLALVIVSAATPAFASDNENKGRPVVAPSAAVAAAWAREDKAADRKSDLVLNSLFASYTVLQGLDFYSTQKALDNGAREANPMMGNGREKAFKFGMAAASMGAAKLVSKKNKKAGIITMFVLNGAMAAVVANNMKNARR